MHDRTPTTAPRRPPAPTNHGDICRRADFRGLVKELRVTEAGRRIRISAGKMHHLVCLIHSYTGGDGECWASLDTLAEQMHVGRRTVVRLLDVLERNSIVCRRKVRNGRHYRVYRWLNFTQLSEFRGVETQGELPYEEPTQETAPTVSDPHENAVSECHGARSECHGARSECHGAHSECHPGGTRSPILKPPTDDKAPCATTPRGIGGGFNNLSKGWRLARDLRPAALNHPPTIQALYAAAVQLQLVTRDPPGRLLWFAFCHNCWRQRNRKTPRPILNLIGWMHGRLAAPARPRPGQKPWWQELSDGDEQAARQTIRALDHPAAPTPPDPADEPTPDWRERLRQEFPNQFQTQAPS